MKIQEKMRKPMLEAKYLNVENTAGSGGFGIMGKPGNNSGYQKGQQY